MTINKEKKDNILTVTLEGRLDTNTAPELDGLVADDLVGIKQLVLNVEKLEYVSSAGLRVILMLHKKMAAKDGSLVIYKPIDDVMDVLDMTGFSTFLKIEEC